jgi:hypothetical protein
LEQAEKELNQFEKSWTEKMDEKLIEHNNVLNAYKDLFSDPYKKHDRHNSFEDEEEEEIKNKLIRQEKATGIDNTWLFEDDKIEKLRRSKENRLTKKYLNHELLKRGVIPDRVMKNKDYLQPAVDDLFAEHIEIKLTPEMKDKNKGRINTNQYDQKQFIEKYLGKDGLHGVYVPLESKRDTLISREVKELRERFPKEKFINSPEQSDSLIQQINSTYLRLINDTDTKDAKYDLYERISPLSPFNKKLQAVLTQREEYLDSEEQRQLITLETFFQKMTNSLTRDDAKFDNIPESAINEEKKKETFYKSHPELYKLRKFTGEEVEPVPETFERKRIEKKEEEQDVTDDFVRKFKFKKAEQEETKTADESNSFKSFLDRRRSQLPAKNKTQFDIKNLNKADIDNAKLESIKEKYKKHVLKPLEKNSVYSFMNKKQNAKKLDSLERQIEIEKKKADFLKEIENNFKEEIETLPTFKDYFQGLKEGINAKQKADNAKVEPLEFKYNYRNNLDKLREKLAVLYTGKVDPQTFEEIFVKDQSSYQNKLKSWVTEQDKQFMWKLVYTKMGITSEQLAETVNENFPEIINSNPAEVDEYFKALKGDNLNHDKIDNLEDLEENEYYFNPQCGQTLEEHLAELSKLEYKNITLRKDNDGRVIIRREYKGNYKYDLDEIMKFDIQKEKERMMAKLQSFDFEANINSDAEFYTQIISYIKNKSLRPTFNTDEIITKTENLIANRYNLTAFNLVDLKNCVSHLIDMPANKMKELLLNLKKIIDLSIGSETTTFNKEVELINEFSADLFKEKEITILSALLKELNTDISKLNFEGIKKFVFIQDVLLGSLLGQLKIILKDDFIIIYSLLKVLPEANEINKEVKKALRSILWDKYKNYMKEQFTITLSKENQINPNKIKEDIEELSRIMTAVNSGQYQNREEEIKKFSTKLKEYYTELSKAGNDSTYHYNDLISDEELFIEEVSEQINKRIERLKKDSERSKPKVNEETLFNKQLDYLNKLDKKYEAMSYNNTEDREFYDEIRKKKNLNALRKERLVKEGKPLIDYNLPRLL